MKTTAVNVTIDDACLLPSLYGDRDTNLRLIENTYGVVLKVRGNRIQIEGEEKSVASVERLIKQLSDMLEKGVISQKDDVNSAINAFSSDPASPLKELFQQAVPVSSRKR